MLLKTLDILAGLVLGLVGSEDFGQFGAGRMTIDLFIILFESGRRWSS